jgi:hypothetical protein
MIDGNDGSKTIAETELVRNESGKIMKVETDMMEVSKEESGTEMIYETNIIEDEKKITVIEN